MVPNNSSFILFFFIFSRNVTCCWGCSHNVQETSHDSTISIRHLSDLQPLRKIRTDLASHQAGRDFFTTYINYRFLSMCFIYAYLSVQILRGTGHLEKEKTSHFFGHTDYCQKGKRYKDGVGEQSRCTKGPKGNLVGCGVSTLRSLMGSLELQRHPRSQSCQLLCCKMSLLLA